jgi:hypothetical protein
MLAMYGQVPVVDLLLFMLCYMSMMSSIYTGHVHMYATVILGFLTIVHAFVLVRVCVCACMCVCVCVCVCMVCVCIIEKDRCDDTGDNVAICVILYCMLGQA